MIINFIFCFYDFVLFPCCGLLWFNFKWNVGDIDATEKPVAPIKVYSEKELMREMEKIASTLVPEKDWSLRIAAMQRVESLVYGGLSALYCFHLSCNYIYAIIL